MTKPGSASNLLLTCTPCSRADCCVLIDDLLAARIEIIDKYLTENNNCCTTNTHFLSTKRKDMLPPNIRKRGEVVLLEMEVKWPHRELDEVTRGGNREFVLS